MNETSNNESEINLIDDTHPEKIMSNTMTKTTATTQRNEGKEIVQKRQEESEQREEDQQSDGRVSPRRLKIIGEELIEGERERSSVRLTLSTEITLGTEAKEFMRMTTISL